MGSVFSVFHSSVFDGVASTAGLMPMSVDFPAPDGPEHNDENLHATRPVIGAFSRHDPCPFMLMCVDMDGYTGLSRVCVHVGRGRVECCGRGVTQGEEHKRALG